MLDVRVWLTPLDRMGNRWRIEVRPDGRVFVFRLTGDLVASAPLRHVRDIGALGEWLVQQGIEFDDLIES